MKMFKISKFLVFILSCILLVSIIAGCGNSAEETVSNTPTPSQGILDETKDNEEENSEIENVKPEATFKRDTYYLGLDLSGMTYKEALEAVKGLTRNYREELDKFSFTVKADDETTLTIKGSDLEFTDKTEVKLAELIVHEKNGNTKMAAEFDKKIIKAMLSEAFDGFNVEAKDAVITGVSDGVVTYEKAVMGKEINLDKTTDLIIESLINLDDTELTPVFDEVEPALTDEMVDNYVCIGYCSTNINTWQSESIYNMKLAMRILDGRVVMPEETLSFMKYMDYAGSYGGFQSGNIIMNGILVPASGGGICQASTTIYGVALDSGMTIIERDNHGIPSSYVKLGLDAMVSAGSSDFIFRNDYETPVILDTSYADRVLYARIYGLQPEEWDDISCDAWVTNTYKATEGVRFIIDPDLEEGEFVLQNDASKGYSTAAQRYYYKDGECVKVENLTNSYYPPRQKTYTIGKDTDTATLENGTEKREEGKIEPSPSPEISPSPEVSPSPEISPSPEVSPSPEATPENTPTTAPTPETTPAPTPESSITPEHSEEPTPSEAPAESTVSDTEEAAD